MLKPNGMSMQDFALNLISRNPRFANNPQAQRMLDVIRSNDIQQGQMIAENLCQTYGVTKEEAISNARTFFGI